MFIYRLLAVGDYLQYLDLLRQFTNYHYDITVSEFTETFNANLSHQTIYVVCDTERNDQIIGAGSIYKMNKLHNHPVGQIEDVIINQAYRDQGLGSYLIKLLVDLGLNEWHCYKIILNCVTHNIKFYEKCGFQVVGHEMKFAFK